MDVIVLCSVCGEPAAAGEDSCAMCAGTHQRAVAELAVKPTSEGRLLASVEQTLNSLDHLRIARAREVYQEAKTQRSRALRTRLEAQAGVLGGRLRSGLGESGGRGYRMALHRAEQELGRSL
jgi:hypothetical protein